MKNESKKTRTECDLLGCVEVPDNVLYGVQTMRGLENFAISKFRLCEYPRFIEGLAIVKLGAAIANHAMGLLSDELFGAISQACREIMAGRFHEFFPVDMIQGGAGTTTNMNANEVIANRALEIMGHARGEYQYCSPNDHVNCSQSTNDAYPSAIHLGLYATHLELRRHLEALIAAFGRKGDEFARVLKMGRTQLQDAVPMTLGQTFHGFASVLRGEVDNLDHAAQEFLSINMGATAIGTGICAEPGYAERCTAAIREITGWDVTLAEDLVGATSDTVCMVGYSSAMKRIASKMNKICNDLRLLSSGPRCGLGEFNLPARQPGSSIMPGKVNPVVPDMLSQIGLKVGANHAGIAHAACGGGLECGYDASMIRRAFHESAEMLARGIPLFVSKVIEGTQPRESLRDSWRPGYLLLRRLLGDEAARRVFERAAGLGIPYAGALQCENLPRNVAEALSDPARLADAEGLAPLFARTTDGLPE